MDGMALWQTTQTLDPRTLEKTAKERPLQAPLREEISAGVTVEHMLPRRAVEKKAKGGTIQMAGWW